MSVAAGRRVPAYLERIDPFGAGTTTLPLADGRLWLRVEPPGAGPAPLPPAAARPLVLALCLGVRDHRGAPLDAADLARRIRTGDDLWEVAPPFAAALVDDGIVFAIDHLGLRHLYAARGPGWAAVSTSARLLARITGADLDPATLGVLRVIGQCLGTSTPFTGVTKLAPGYRWRLRHGDLTALQQAAPPPIGAEWTPRSAAALLREITRPYLDHPDLVIELSGGLDSRIALAAVPASRRAGVRALTLAAPGDADGRVARQVAGATGVRHHVVDLSGLAGIDPVEAHRRVIDAARRHDCAGNPVSHAALDWAEEQVEPGMRITGQAGEMIRGLYFLEPRSDRVRAWHVNRTARWWFTGNEAVPPACLNPDFAALSRRAVRDQLHAVFAGYDMDWRSARDEFLLRERAHRWAGLTYTGACLRRVIGSPFFDHRFLQMARELPPAVKAYSAFSARVLEELDADLARLPLASGMRPTALPGLLGGYSARGALKSVTRKLAQRVRTVNRPPAGTAALARRVLDHWRAEPHVLDAVPGTGLVDPGWLAGLLRGEHDAGPATVGFLADLQVAARSLDQSRTLDPSRAAW